MGYLSENIIPGKSGKTFLVGINNIEDYQAAVRVLSKIQGIGKIDYTDKVYPHELTIFTARPVPVKEIQQRMKYVGLHALPKTFFSL